MAWLQVIVGFIVLIWSAEKLVSSSAQLAHQLGVKPLVIGLTIIGFGTSAPEIFVSINASLSDSANVAIGNAIGSNIANIGLVIGACSILQPIPLPSDSIKKELLLLISLSLVIASTVSYFGFQIWNGLLLIFLLSGFMFWLLKSHLDGKGTESAINESDIDLTNKQPYSKLILILLISIVFLIVSSKVLVAGAVTLAEAFGVSQTFIGLTLIALGTSLPELATSIASIMKKHHSIAIGNIIGSNIFNLTAVLAPVAFFQPGLKLNDAVIWRDIPTMLMLTMLFCLPIFKSSASKYAFGRSAGIVFLILYTGYLTFLMTQATNMV